MIQTAPFHMPFMDEKGFDRFHWLIVRGTQEEVAELLAAHGFNQPHEGPCIYQGEPFRRKTDDGTQFGIIAFPEGFDTVTEIAHEAFHLAFVMRPFLPDVPEGDPMNIESGAHEDLAMVFDLFFQELADTVCVYFAAQRDLG